MKTLLLLRHAKSSWNDSSREDHDRPLNERGRLSAPVAGQYLLDRGLLPDLILSSTALRARETVERAVRLWPRAVETHYEKGLYLAPPHKILQRIHKTPDGVTRLLMVGHNPGYEALACELAGHGDPDAIERIHEKFPTAGLAVIGFDVVHWRDLRRGEGNLLAFVAPRDLI